MGLDRLFAAVEDHTAALIQLIEHASDEEAVSRIMASRAAPLNSIVWLLQILGPQRQGCGRQPPNSPLQLSALMARKSPGRRLHAERDW